MSVRIRGVQCELPGGHITAAICKPDAASVADTVLEGALTFRVSKCVNASNARMCEYVGVLVG